MGLKGAAHLVQAILYSAVVSQAVPGSIRIPLQHRHVPFVRTTRGVQATRGVAVRNATGGADDVPMMGSAQRFGEYYVDVVVGGRIFSLMLDTGSSDLAIQAAKCDGCPVKSHLAYNPNHTGAVPMGCDWCSAHKSDSTQLTCKQVHRVGGKKCTFRTTYADATFFSAALYNDTFTFADGANAIQSLEVNVAVGAIYYAKFPNPKSVDGIIGFGGPEAASTGAQTPFATLVAAAKTQNMFSICLHPNGNGGHLYLGHDSLPTDLTSTQQKKNSTLPMPTVIQGTLISETQWTPMLTSEGYYGVGVTDVRVNGTSLGVASKIYNDGQAIIDSGTQDVSIPHTAFKSLKSHFEKLCTTHCLKGTCDCERRQPLTKGIFENRCVEMTQAQKDAYPVIEVEMSGGAKVQYPPSSYLKNGAQFCGDRDLDAYTIAISSQADGDGTIFGETFMQGYLVVHDRENSRMGFQPVSEDNCPGMAGSESVIV